MNYQEITDLLRRFVDGSEITEQEFIILFEDGYIEKESENAWMLSEYGKKIFKLIKSYNFED